MTGAFDIHKDSLDPAIARELTEKGVIVVPLPKELVEGHGEEQLGIKTCQQYALPAFAENLVIVDNGYAKVHTSFVPLHLLRRIPGFERAHVCAPAARGGVGNSMRYLAMAPRDDALQVEGLANLFCAGEKAGPFVGHTEAIVTGSLAGHNAVRLAAGMEPLVLPDTTLLGDIIAYVNTQVTSPDGLGQPLHLLGRPLLRAPEGARHVHHRRRRHPGAGAQSGPRGRLRPAAGGVSHLSRR